MTIRYTHTVIAIGIFIIFNSCNSTIINEKSGATENIEKSKTDIPDSLKARLSTKRLTYQIFACDCPNFAAMESRDTTLPYGFSELYYIEPANETLIIPDELIQNSSEFEFEGIETNTNGLPKFANFQDSPPTKGRVFTYWSYKQIEKDKGGTK